MYYARLAGGMCGETVLLLVMNRHRHCAQISHRLGMLHHHRMWHLRHLLRNLSHMRRHMTCHRMNLIQNQDFGRRKTFCGESRRALVSFGYRTRLSSLQRERHVAACQWIVSLVWSVFVYRLRLTRIRRQSLLDMFVWISRGGIEIPEDGD